MPDDPFIQRPDGSPSDRARDARSGRGEHHAGGSRMVWRIFAALAVLLLLVASAPLWPIVFLIFLLAAAVLPPLLAVPTLAAYTALIAAVTAVLRLVGVPRKRAWLAGAFVAIAVGFGVPYLAEHRAQAAAWALVASDLAQTGTYPADSIELVLPLRDIRASRPGAPLRCEALCQALLLGGDVAWVRISAPEPRPSTRAPRHPPMDYRIEASDACPSTFDAGEAQPETRRAMARGTCIVAWPEAAAQAPNARMILDRSPPWTRPSDAPSWLAWRRRVEIQRRDADGWQVVARQTGIDLRPPRYPLFLVPGGGKENAHLAIARRHMSLAPADPEAMLRSAFGFSIAMPPDDHGGSRAAVRALLARSGSAAFDAAMNRVITETLAALARQPVIDADDAALVASVVADARVTDASAAEVLRRHAHLAAALAPAILTRLEVPGDNAARRAYAFVLAGLPREAWRADTPRIIRLLSNNQDPAIAGLRTIAGQLGVDPTTWMTVWLRIGPTQRSLDGAATRGICQSDPQWWADLAPLLESAIRSAHRVGQRALSGDEGSAFVALHRIGAPGQARALFDELHGSPDRFVQQQAERIFGTEATGAGTPRSRRACQGSF